MRKKIKAFFENPWIITIGSGLIVLIVTIAIDVITADKVFSTIMTVTTSIWTIIITALNFEIKVWWMLVAILMVILGLFLLIRLANKKVHPPAQPKFLQYTKDTILGFKWEWDWEKYGGTYHVENLRSICFYCDTPLKTKSRGYGKYHICLRCNSETCRAMPEKDDIIMLIRDNARREDILDKILEG